LLQFNIYIQYNVLLPITLAVSVLFFGGLLFYIDV